MSNASPVRYSLAARCLHWAIALLIFFSIGLGYYLTTLGYYDPNAQSALHYHRAIGMLALLLAVLFCLLHLLQRRPSLDEVKPWEKIAAYVMHYTLLFMMLAIPISGYLISTSAGDAIPLFGDISIPAVMTLQPDGARLAEQVHLILAWMTGALALLHGSAALKHHFIDRHDTLRKML